MQKLIFPKNSFLPPKERGELWRKKYCEWKWGELLDYIGNNIKCEIITDCGEKIIYTKNNKYGELLKNEKAVCPFCNKKITICDYD